MALARFLDGLRFCLCKRTLQDADFVFLGLCQVLEFGSKRVFLALLASDLAMERLELALGRDELALDLLVAYREVV